MNTPLMMEILPQADITFVFNWAIFLRLSKQMSPDWSIEQSGMGYN
jgi:hypothetical protein